MPWGEHLRLQGAGADRGAVAELTAFGPQIPALSYRLGPHTLVGEGREHLQGQGRLPLLRIQPGLPEPHPLSPQPRGEPGPPPDPGPRSHQGDWGDSGTWRGPY